MHYAGSVSDITIMKNRVDKHRYRLKKVEADKDLNDNEVCAADKNLSCWAVLAYKGYQTLMIC